MARRTLALIVTAGLLALGGTLAGCASSGPPFVDETPGSDMAVVYVYRPAKTGASATDFKILFDGQHLVSLTNGGYFAYVAPPGRVTVRAEPKASVMNFGLGLLTMGTGEVVLDVAPGESYYVHLDVGGSSGTQLSMVNRPLRAWSPHAPA